MDQPLKYPDTDEETVVAEETPFYHPAHIEFVSAERYAAGRSWLARVPGSELYDRQALERVIDVVQILGHKGITATPDAARHLAFLWFGWETMVEGPFPSSTRRALERACRLGLARVVGVDPTFGGRSTKFYALTEQGKELYTTLWERAPNEQLERSLARHGGGEQGWLHTALVAATASLLDWLISEEVDRDPRPIQVGKHWFAPDLAVRETEWDDWTFYIECERQKRSLAEREQKWRNAYEVGQGEIYVVCPTPRVRKHFVRQIRRLFAGDPALRLYATDIQTVRTGQLGECGFWVEEPPSEPISLRQQPFWQAERGDR